MITTYTRQIIVSIFFLILGACIYILFREPVIFTEPITHYGVNLPIFPLDSGLWSNLLRFTLPDALWITALLIYSSTTKLKGIRIIALILAPTYEIGQFFGLIWGTFDYLDLIVYLIISIIFIKKWKNEKI